MEADGGGMYNDGNHPTVANCTFSGNTADWGGGMYNYYGSSPTVSNCILWDNTATSDGNEIYNDPDISHPAIPLISYGDIAGSGGSTSWDPNLGSDANGNIEADPCFVDPGYWDMNDVWVDGDYHLLVGSPCIDAGDNNSVPADSIDLDNDGNTAEPIPWDLDENPRIVDGNDDGNAVIDMGAYEFFWPPVECWLRIHPRTINRTSRDKYIIASLQLPPGITKDQIEDEKLMFSPGDIEASRQLVLRRFINGTEQVTILAFFSRLELTAAIPDNGRAELEVSGKLTTGQIFYGTDTIRIINPKNKPRPNANRYRRRRSQCQQ
jgi:hypothetical protein